MRLRQMVLFSVAAAFALAARAEVAMFPEGTFSIVPPPDAAATAQARAWDHGVPFAQLVRDAAKAVDVRPELLHALIVAESGYRANARSPAGAMGVMQLMPGVLRRYGVRNPMDPQQNILAGAKYVRELLDLFEGNVSLVLAAYNAGEHAVLRNGKRVPSFTRGFVSKVTSLFDRFSHEAHQAPGE